MAERWDVVKIGDLGEIYTGRTPSTEIPEYFGDKYPFITPGDMHNKKNVHETSRYLSDKGAELLKRIRLPKGAVCVSCIGWQMGNAVMTGSTAFTNQQINSIVTNDRVIPDFLYYTFVPRKIELLSVGSASGVRTPIMNKSTFANLTVSIPSNLTQQKISSILSTYDNLIENNTRRIKILDEMAQAIYREWFVDFRFPGHEGVQMVESELGLVPEGWEVNEVKNLVKRLTAGQVYTQLEITDEGQVPVIDQSRDEILGYHNNDPDHNASPVSPIIIFGDHTCKMQLLIEPFSVGPNVIPFISANNIPILYLFFLVRNLVETKEYKRHWIELTTKVIVVAPSKQAQLFSEIVKPYFEYLRLLKLKNTNLRRTRDLLLPKLISGELDVSELDIEIPATL